jgi:hypothetical protein
VDWGGIEVPNKLTGAGGIYIGTEITAGKINKKWMLQARGRRLLQEDGGCYKMTAVVTR